jgi:hypothetical protein
MQVGAKAIGIELPFSKDKEERKWEAWSSAEIKKVLIYLPYGLLTEQERGDRCQFEVLSPHSFGRTKEDHEESRDTCSTGQKFGTTTTSNSTSELVSVLKT